MQVDEKTVRRIARLARIKVTDAEAKGLEKELSGLLDWVKQLDEVDTKAVEPMVRVVPIAEKRALRASRSLRATCRVRARPFARASRSRLPVLQKRILRSRAVCARS